MKRPPRKFRFEIRPDDPSAPPDCFRVPLNGALRGPGGHVCNEANVIFRQLIEAGIVGDDDHRDLMAALFEHVFGQPIDPTIFPFYDIGVPDHARPH